MLHAEVAELRSNLCEGEHAVGVTESVAYAVTVAAISRKTSLFQFWLSVSYWSRSPPALQKKRFVQRRQFRVRAGC